MADTTPQLTPRDIAGRLGCDVERVICWIMEGRLKATEDLQTGHRVTVPDFKEFLDRFLFEILDQRKSGHHFQMMRNVLATLLSLEQEGRERPDRTFRNYFHLLVIDDSPTLCKLIAKGLEAAEERLIVDQAFNGYEACMQIVREPVDLAIVDILMPGFDGLNLIRLLRALESTRSIPVIVMSGMLTPEIEQELTRLGVQNILPKPVALKKLLLEVKLTLDLTIPPGLLEAM